MKKYEILSIVALALLGVCLLCGLTKMAMKSPIAKQSCDHACSLSLFVALVLLGVSQLLKETGPGAGDGFGDSLGDGLEEEKYKIGNIIWSKGPILNNYSKKTNRKTE